MKKTLLISLLILAVFSGCQQNKWTLTSGTPPYADPNPLVYEGNVELNGWLVVAPAYVVGTEEKQFHVSDESLKNLPADINRADFRLVTTDEIIIKELEKFSENNPAKISADKITVVMEGNPTMHIEKILE